METATWPRAAERRVGAGRAASKRAVERPSAVIDTARWRSRAHVDFLASRSSYGPPSPRRSVKYMLLIHQGTTPHRRGRAPPGRARRRARPVHRAFTPSHRGGAGSPLVCLHGFMETWRTWELVLPALERRHDVLAPTLPGHAGGPALEGPPTGHLMADAVERAMDDAGFDTAHVVGSSLGGFVALQLAARGRARTVVAFAPAGGWARDDTVARRGAGPAGATARAGQGDGAARRGDRRHGRGPAPGDAARRLELRAHPGRAHRPPDARASRAPAARRR